MSSRRSAGAAVDLSRRSPGTGEEQTDGGMLSRRVKSTSKLRDGSTAASLNDALAHFQKIEKHMAMIAEESRKAALSLSAWGKTGRNAAIADVAGCHADLLRLSSSQFQRAAADHGSKREELRKINDLMKEVAEKQRRLDMLEEKSAKLFRSINRGPGLLRRRSADEMLRKGEELRRVREEMDHAERDLIETKREAEVCSMLHYRRGMQGMAAAHQRLHNACEAIFSCHHEITESVPAISTQDPLLMNYDGAPVTRECMARLKRAFDMAATGSPPESSQLMGQIRRRSAGVSRVRRSQSEAPPMTPPPPYTPTAPALSLLTSSGGSEGSPSSSEGESSSVSPPRPSHLYPRLPTNPYIRRRSGLHS